MDNFVEYTCVDCQDFSANWTGYQENNDLIEKSVFKWNYVAAGSFSASGRKKNIYTISERKQKSKNDIKNSN